MSYHIDPGEVVAIVGESGSGKTPPRWPSSGCCPNTPTCRDRCGCTARNCSGCPTRRCREIRGKTIGTVFQDPMSALTPVYTVGDQIAEAIKVHNRDISRAGARKRAVELLELVGIAQPQRRARAFPHELSGGERQRVVIAIAIANDPDLLICDEPTTALDVTVQAQILDVLRTARDVTGAGVLIITHDLGVVVGVRRPGAGHVRRTRGRGRRRRRALPRPPDALHGRAAGIGAATGRPAGHPADPDPRRAADDVVAVAGPARSPRAARWRSTNVVRRNPISLPSGTATGRRASAPTTSRAAARPKSSACQRNRRQATPRPPNPRWCCGSPTSPRPTHSPRAWCCAGGWARCGRSTASASPWSRAAPWASSANPVRANRRR